MARNYLKIIDSRKKPNTKQARRFVERLTQDQIMEHLQGILPLLDIYASGLSPENMTIEIAEGEFGSGEMVTDKGVRIFMPTPEQEIVAVKTSAEKMKAFL